MKNFSIYIALMLITLSSFATDPKEAVIAASAANLNEVINNIEYPEASMENGIEGRVVVLLKVNKEGAVSFSQVTRAPNEDLKQAVEKVVDQLKFTPAKTASGEAVDSFVKIPVDFKLTID